MWAKTTALPSFAPESVLRSALCLKLHAFNDTGAIIAAATTSIPEALGSGRTWDYRFCWLRDAAFVVEALRRLSHLAEGEAFVRFLREMADSGPLQPMYGITGKRDLHEEIVPTPARLRRRRAGAHRQCRLRAAAARRRRRDGAVPRDDPHRSARGLGGSDAGAAARASRRRGDGVVRASSTPASGNTARSRGTTPSRRRCAGSPRIAAPSWPSSSACPNARGDGARGRTRSGRSSSTAPTTRSSAIFTQAFDGEHPDASNLLLPALGLIDPLDPRFRSTVRAYEKLLAPDGLMLRYKHLDDFGHTTSAFSICSFWWVEALAMMGEVDEAVALFHRLEKYANPLGLFSEDIEPSTGALLGNFPQAYTHVGLIHAAITIGEILDARHGSFRAWSLITYVPQRHGDTEQFFKRQCCSAALAFRRLSPCLRVSVERS